MDIHIGNFHYQVNEGQLKELFGSYGQVASVRIMKDKYTGESQGFGFIVMPDENEALQAIAHLNNFQMGNRVLTVSKVRPLIDYRLLYLYKN